MPRLAANISLLFPELAPLERVDAAARAGFTAIEVQFPYDLDVAALGKRLKDAGLACVLHNLPAGDWAAGDRGLACDPGRTKEFRTCVERGLQAAGVLGCPRLNALAGIPPAGAEQAAVWATLVDNLAWAGERLGEAGLGLLTEPLNAHDVPGFAITGTRQALELVHAVGPERLALQYDLYHMAMMGEDLAADLAAHLPQVGHVQVADAPGRHEPGTGGLDVPGLFAALDEAGYAGWVGCEYVPAGDTAEGLAWARAWLGEG